MYKRILVPLDGSRYAEEIIPYAKGLAATHGAELVLLRVADDSPGKDSATDYVDQLATAHAARGLCLLEAEEVADAILDEAHREPQTLLAMTSRGRSGLLELALGSVSQRVLRGAHNAVLVYHPTGVTESRHSLPSPQRVVLALAAGDSSGGMADETARFARWIGAELEVVSVLKPLSATDRAQVPETDFAVMESKFVRSAAEKLAAKHGVRVNWDTLYGDPATAIVEHVAGKRETVLAMSTRRKSALEAAFLGSVTAGCLRRAGVPILMRAP